MDSSTDMGNIVGKMDLYIEVILKMGNAKGRASTITQKMEVLQEVFGKMVCCMEVDNI